MVTCRFGVRPHSIGGSDCFEVFDRLTGVPVASGMRRVEAEADARRRNQDTSGLPAELAALLAAIETYVTSAGHHSRTLVARAAQALDELRDELDHAGRLIAERHALLGEIYKLFPDPDDSE